MFFSNFEWLHQFNIVFSGKCNHSLDTHRTRSKFMSFHSKPETSINLKQKGINKDASKGGKYSTLRRIFFFLHFLPNVNALRLTVWPI